MPVGRVGEGGSTAACAGSPAVKTEGLQTRDSATEQRLTLIQFLSNDFVEIIEMLDKRLVRPISPCSPPPLAADRLPSSQNDKGKNWRHVFKSLTLLDYCLHAGSENVVQYFRSVVSALSLACSVLTLSTSQGEHLHRQDAQGVSVHRRVWQGSGSQW